MSLHAFLVLTVISVQLLKTQASPVFTEAQCTLPPRERTDCGFGGIGEQECNRNGCCFDSRIPGVIWCYKVPRPALPEIQEPQVDPVPQVQEPQVDPVPQVQEPQVDPVPQVQEPQVDPVPQVQEPQVDEPEVCLE